MHVIEILLLSKFQSANDKHDTCNSRIFISTTIVSIVISTTFNNSLPTQDVTHEVDNNHEVMTEQPFT